MRHFLLLISVVALITFQLLGCSEDTEPEETLLAPVESDTEVLIPITPVTPEPETPEKLFEILWDEYGGHFNDQDELDVLRVITTSQTYLDYLAETFPTDEPVETLEEYFQIADPDPERYVPILKQWTHRPTDEDIAAIHKITTTYRELNFVLFARAGDNFFFLFQKQINLMLDPMVKDFMERHKIRQEPDTFDLFAEIADETEVMDATWLHEQLDTFGREHGLVWSVLQRPALMGEILLNFPSIDLFLQWMELSMEK